MNNIVIILIVEVITIYDSISDSKRLVKAVDIPIELYQSDLGKYFIGYADNLTLSSDKSA